VKRVRTLGSESIDATFLERDPGSFKSDADRVAFLFELYQEYTSLLPSLSKKAGRRREAS